MKGHRLTILAVAVCFSGLRPDTAVAAGFSLIEQGASGLGVSFAGAAAVAEDASTIWFNPAGMTMLSGHQVLAAGHVISPSIQFSNTASTAPAGIATLGGNGGDAGDLAVVPNLYASVSLSDRLKLGLGVTVPFGLMTEYDSNFIGRFQGLKSEITAFNINPSVAFKVSERISLGAGLSYQRVEAELTNARVLGVATEGLSRLEGDGTAFGFNLGALFTLDDDMRLGVGYRSGIKHELKGDAVLRTAAGTVVPAGTFPIRGDLELPAIASLSIVQRYTPEWDLLGDVTWTQWSSIQSVRIINANTGANPDTLNLFLKDAWRIALGVHYRPNDRWVVKGGFAWDQSPVEDAHRTVRMPDTDRYWLSFGAKYRFSDSMAIDAGYVHIFGVDVSIDQTQDAAATRGRVVGNYETSVDILSVQASFAF